MEAQKITAIVDQTNLDKAGAIVFINYDGNLSRTALEDAWTEAGLDEGLLPEFNSFKKALTRAVDEVARSNGLIKLKKPGGWNIVDKASDATVGESAGTIECLVELNVVNTLQITPDDHPYKDDLSEAYFRHLYTVSTSDAGDWIRGRLLPRVNALGLRDRGGVDFIARQHLDTWHTMVACIQSASSHRVHEIPALHGDETAAAVMDALINETDDAIKRCEAVIDDDSKGERALKTQSAKLGRLVKKLSAFEELVGDKLDTLRDQLSDAKAATAEAILIATSEEVL